MSLKKKKLQKLIVYLEDLKPRIPGFGESAERKKRRVQEAIDLAHSEIHNNKTYSKTEVGAMFETTNGLSYFVLDFELPIIMGERPPIVCVDLDWCRSFKITKQGSTFKEYIGRPGEGKSVTMKVTKIY